MSCIMSTAPNRTRHTALISTTALLFLCGAVFGADQVDAMRSDPGSAVAELRRLQYANQAEATNAYLAPAAPGFVDRKAKAANIENVQRIHNGVYGFEVIAAKADGDAGAALLLAAYTDKDGPKVEFYPFYMWRHEGTWKFLPNPLEVETWYQSVPDKLKPGYERLSAWIDAQKVEHAGRLATTAAELIEEWRAGHQAANDTIPEHSTPE